MIELDLTKFDHLRHVATLEQVQGTNEEVHVRKMIGSAALPDGTYVNFEFELTKLGEPPKACLTDETASYIVTVVRYHHNKGSAVPGATA